MRSLPRWISAASLALAACGPEAERVYVPAEGYTISVQISLPDEARVGEWIVLSAQRRSGPWKAVARDAVPPGFVPFERPPPEHEREVADNLRWMTDLPGARFELPVGGGHGRKVQFEKPGTYRLWARNAYPTDAQSNVLTLEVR